MYSKSARLQLPFSSLTEEFKIAKARNLVTFQESNDPCIHGAELEVDEGRKANTKEEIEIAKSRLRMQEIIGVTNIGKEGLGMRKAEFYSKSSSKSKRDMIIKVVREKEEEERIVKMTTLSKQGSHNMKWEAPQRRLNQSDLITMPDERLKFLIKSVYDLLPTPANKSKWFNSEETCLLCGENGTLNHILAGCKVSLSQGRYKWRHDRVLKELASSMQTKLLENLKKPGNQTRRNISFVKAGESSERKQSQPESFLSDAKDWKMSVDLQERLRIPPSICVTDMRPDITLISPKTKKMVIIELTVPTEDRMEVAGESKRLKYQKIVIDGKQNGWIVRCWAVEVGCRGFPAYSMSNCLKDMGFAGKERKKVVEKLGSIAESASRSLWKASHYKEWGGKKD